MCLIFTANGKLHQCNHGGMIIRKFWLSLDSMGLETIPMGIDVDQQQYGIITVLET